MDSRLEQPNFARAADALHVLAHEVQLCPNIQAARDAARLDRILEELVALRRSISAFEQKTERNFIKFDERLSAFERKTDQNFAKVNERLSALEQKSDEVVKRLTTLELSSKVTQHNFPAVVYNSHIRDQGVKLAPLCSSITGEIVEATSLTVDELNNLSATKLSELLEQLGLSKGGNAPAKKQRLKFVLGIIEPGTQLPLREMLVSTD